MKYPDRRFFWFTWVGWINFLILQWLFVRIVGRFNERGQFAGWGLLGPVLPLTGWWGYYQPRHPLWLLGRRH